MGVIKNSIKHVAIIPDGNRRWGRKNRVLNEYAIYEEGSEKFDLVMNYFFNMGIRNVTFWVSSVSNLKERSMSLIKATNKLYEEKFQELLDSPSIMKNGVKVNVFGNWRELLGGKTIEIIEKLLRKTAGNSQYNLSLLVGYDGKLERGHAVKSLLQHVSMSDYKEKLNEIEAEALLRRHAWTGGLADVDLIIRTGSWEDPHNSADFLSFLSGNSQLFFPEMYWPDIDQDCLERVVSDYLKRERRFGK